VQSISRADAPSRYPAEYKIPFKCFRGPLRETEREGGDEEAIAVRSRDRAREMTRGVADRRIARTEIHGARYGHANGHANATGTVKFKRARQRNEL